MTVKMAIIKRSVVSKPRSDLCSGKRAGIRDPPWVDIFKAMVDKS